MLPLAIISKRKRFKMRYLVTIYEDEAASEQFDQQKQQEIYEGYNAFTRHVRELGVSEGGEALLPTSSATTVRVRDGKVLTTDGPFAETKEQLGGYYLLNCKDLDEAIKLAAQIPSAAYGSVEIRPIMEFPDAS
jgi:hypothetical protein